MRSTDYLGVALDSAAEWKCCILTSVIAARLFVVGFQRIGGCTRERTLDALFGIRSIVVVVLLLEFVGKASKTYSGSWTLSWAVST